MEYLSRKMAACFVYWENDVYLKDRETIVFGKKVM